MSKRRKLSFDLQDLYPDDWEDKWVDDEDLAEMLRGFPLYCYYCGGRIGKILNDIDKRHSSKNGKKQYRKNYKLYCENYNNDVEMAGLEWYSPHFDDYYIGEWKYIKNKKKEKQNEL
jgi:hypothetical protein